jgi:diacylglycerol O-acyltransferase / wax synthase
MRTYLSPLDATLLEIEEVDESAHMQIGWAMVFEPLPAGERPSLEKLRRQVRTRVEETSILRRRLSVPRVGRYSLPIWLPDPAFDVGQQIRCAALPEPGGEAELTAWLGEHFSQRLDRSRPLWEATLLEGLAGRRWAIVCKVHHCLIDGFNAASVAAALLDGEPEPEEGPTALAQLLDSLGEESQRGVLTRLRGVVGDEIAGGIDAALQPHDVATILARSQAITERVVREQSAPTPITSLNGPIGPDRRLAAVDVSLEELKRVRQEFGGTVNDVVMAAIAGGLRRLFMQREEDVDHVSALVLRNLQGATESLARGRGISSLSVEMAISEPDPLLRYRKIAAAGSELKSEPAATPTTGGLTPPIVQSVIARLAVTPRLFNLPVANMAAPPFTVYALGSPLRRVIPVVPLCSGQALGVAAVGYCGRVFFGLSADRDTVPDLDVLSAGIKETLSDLARVAA